MNIHYLQQVPFEGPGSIEDFCHSNNHPLSCTRLFAGDVFPSLDHIDWLIVMGGPMGIHAEDHYPWLLQEKKFIGDAIDANKFVLGICLGAQLIADVLGVRVFKNPFREIGWHPIETTDAFNNSILSACFPKKIEVFHWHGDTFELPGNAIPIANSEACQNQGFVIDDRVIAFQFHPEITRQAANGLIENCRAELDGSPYVQTADELLTDERRFSRSKALMAAILKTLTTQK